MATTALSTTTLLSSRRNPQHIRTVLVSGVSLLGFPGVSLAVVKQGLLAGRIPGLSEPDEQ
ncbi:psbP domain-containing protein 4 chloroplastic-like, partial [Trifolium pratense]